MSSTLKEKSEFMNVLQEICNNKTTQLFKIWETIGYKKIDEKIYVLCQRVEERLNYLVNAEANYQYYLAVKIEKKLKEAAKLCSEVGDNYETLTTGLEDKNVPLMKVDHILDARLQKCRESKEDRIKRYNEFLLDEQKICDTLMIPKRQKLLRVPREEDLEEFAKYIAEKVSEESERKKEFENIKKEVIQITGELKCSPHTSFHKMVLNDQCISFTKVNMILLKELHQFLQEQLYKTKCEAQDLREKLQKLWEFLDVESEMRERFLEEYSGHSVVTIGALKSEVENCEEQRRKCFKVSVVEMRQILVEWWDKCCFGKMQRRAFNPFYIECYTEDLIELHELEIEKLKNYYSENNEILLLAMRLELLWKRLFELHDNSTDPKRLFTNRGGRLLKEEKELKTIQKDLPIVEKQMKQLLESFEEKTGKLFLYNDEDLRDVMKTYRSTYGKKKENMKVMRTRSKEQCCSGNHSPAPKRLITRLNTPVTVPRKGIKTKSPLSIQNVQNPSTTPPRCRVKRLCCRSGKT